MSHNTISFEFDRDSINFKDLANNRDEAVPLVIIDHMIKKWDFFVGFASLLKLPSIFNSQYRDIHFPKILRLSAKCLLFKPFKPKEKIR